MCVCVCGYDASVKSQTRLLESVRRTLSFVRSNSTTTTAAVIYGEIERQSSERRANEREFLNEWKKVVGKKRRRKNNNDEKSVHRAYNDKCTSVFYARLFNHYIQTNTDLFDSSFLYSYQNTAAMIATRNTYAN